MPIQAGIYYCVNRLQSSQDFVWKSSQVNSTTCQKDHFRILCCIQLQYCLNDRTLNIGNREKNCCLCCLLVETCCRFSLPEIQRIFGKKETETL